MPTSRGIGISPLLKRRSSGSSNPTSSNSTVQAWLNKIGVSGYTYPTQAKVDIYTTAWDYADAQSLTAEFDLLGLLKVENQNLCKIPFIHSGGAARRFDLVNSPIFTANNGLKSDGFSSYLNTNWTPSVDKIKYTLLSCSFGLSTNHTVSGDDLSAMGVLGNNGEWITVWPRNSGGDAFIITNSAFLQTSVVTSAGFISANTISPSASIVKNGVVLFTDNAGTGLPNIELYVCCENTAGFGGSFYPGNIQFFFTGSGSMDQTKLNTFVNLLLL